MTPAPERPAPLPHELGEAMHSDGWLTADDTVTGDAVALDLPAASLGLRMLSALIDIISMLVVIVVLVFALVLATATASEAKMQTASILVIVLGLLVYPTTVETLSRGRSLGKWAVGLRVVRDDAGPISAQHAFTRALIGAVEIYLMGGAPAFLTAMLNPRAKRLGDFAAGTYVVRERVRLTLPPAVVVPVELQAWAQSADIAPLPPALAVAVRQFLGRAATLSPAARVEVGSALHRQVCEHVAPLPGPGVHPEAFMAAVLGERGRRDALRLAGEERLRQRLRLGGTGSR